MGEAYRWGYNPFSDFFVEIFKYDINISDKELFNSVNSEFTLILKNALDNPNDVVYLDFEIINNDEYYIIKGKNAISAMWLSGFLPNDINLLLNHDKFIIGDKKYSFDRKTNTLTYILLDE